MMEGGGSSCTFSMPASCCCCHVLRKPFHVLTTWKVTNMLLLLYHEKLELHYPLWGYPMRNGIMEKIDSSNHESQMWPPVDLIVN